MSPLISPLINSLDAPWAKVAGVYRRICLLRANGHDAEADRVQAEELAPARVAAERETHSADSPESELLIQSLLDAEDARVAEALLFAEILAPLIAERIRPLLVLGPVASRPPFPSDRESPRALPPPSVRSEATPSIAALIDGMLAQERGRPSR